MLFRSKRYRVYEKSRDRLLAALSYVALAPRTYSGHDLWAVRHVALCIEPGETVGIIGRNGSGKSTLLKAISGLVEASAGAVVFDGRDMTYAPPHEVAARGITQVPGGQGVFPTLTVRENLQLAGWLHRRDRAAARARTEEVLDLFPILRERMEEPAGNLSGGQQQMLTQIGRAHV